LHGPPIGSTRSCIAVRDGPSPLWGKHLLSASALLQIAASGGRVSARWLQRSDEVEGVGGQRPCRSSGVDIVSDRPGGSTAEGLCRLCWRRPSKEKLSGPCDAGRRIHLFGVDCALAAFSWMSSWGSDFRSRPEVVKLRASQRWSGCSTGALLRGSYSSSSDSHHQSELANLAAVSFAVSWR